MAAHRYVKPFIVAGLTSALSLSAPISALAEGVVAADNTTAPAAAIVDDASTVDATGTADATASVALDVALAGAADAGATSRERSYELSGTTLDPDGSWVLYANTTWVNSPNDPFFSVTYLDDNGATQTLEGATFQSSDNSVLTVSSDGVNVATHNPGEVTVTAYYNNEVIATLTYKVIKMPLTQEQIDRTSLAVQTFSDTGLAVTGDVIEGEQGLWYNVSAVSYDIAGGPLMMVVSPFLYTDVENIESVTVTSSNDAVAAIGENTDYGNFVTLVGAGSATLTATISFNDQQGMTGTVTRTIQVTVTDSSAAQTPENPPAETEQPKDEQKPQDTTDKKNKSDGEGLPETGDPAFVAMGTAGLAGVGAVAAGVRSRRRED